jgi:hypothetical protein
VYEYLAIVVEDVAISILDGVFGSILGYCSECSCENMVSGYSYTFSGFYVKGTC